MENNCKYLQFTSHALQTTKDNVCTNIIHLYSIILSLFTYYNIIKNIIFNLFLSLKKILINNNHLKFMCIVYIYIITFNMLIDVSSRFNFQNISLNMLKLFIGI